jgi:hypothetical protein
METIAQDCLFACWQMIKAINGREGAKIKLHEWVDAISEAFPDENKTPESIKKIIEENLTQHITEQIMKEKESIAPNDIN